MRKGWKRLSVFLMAMLVVCSMAISASATEVQDSVVDPEEPVGITEVVETEVVDENKEEETETTDEVDEESTESSEEDVAPIRFDDVLPEARYYEAVSYIAAEGITSGVGNNRYAPDANISVREWCVMVCRALDLWEALEREAMADFFGQACSNECYWNGWIPMEAVIDPMQNMCRGAFYEIVFDTFGIDTYAYELYPDGESINQWENAARIAIELGICEEGADYKELVTRGEAAYALWCMLTNEYQVVVPPLANDFPIDNPYDMNLNRYLQALNEVPEAILDDFKRMGWTFSLDFDYINDFSERHNMQAVGVCDSGRETIYVCEPMAVMHEFGHFVDHMQGWRSYRFWHEHEAASAFLRDYAMTNAHEYYADYFVYFMEWHDVEWRAAEMQELTPDTYAHFVSLMEKNWDVR